MISKRVKIIFIAIPIALILLIAYAYLETFLLKTTEVEIISKDVPEGFNNCKILFVSDIHCGPYFSEDRVNELVEKINSLEPDLIILGGDYVRKSDSEILFAFRQLKNLKSKLGIFAVLGNHDYWTDAKLTMHFIDVSGFKSIENHSFWVHKGNDSIKIGGVGDLWEGIQILDSTVHDVQPNDFCILVTHNPDYCEKITSDKIDMVLAGHTHGGQVTFFGLWSPILPSKYDQKYDYGLKEFEQFKLYITSGVGTITPPLRFFMRPEIVVFKLKKR